MIYRIYIRYKLFCIISSMARYNGRLHCIVGVLPTCYKRKAATYFYPPPPGWQGAVECGFVNVPLHNIYLSSDLVNGPVAVGIRQILSFKGDHLLLSTDLAGDKVVVYPLVTDTPCMDQPPDPIEQELPDLYPSCAVTRAMVKKAMLTENQSDVDLTDSFFGQSFKNKITKSLSHNLSENRAELIDSISVSDHFSLSLVEEDNDIKSRSQLSKEQHKDLNISSLFQKNGQ